MNTPILKPARRQASLWKVFLRFILPGALLGVLLLILAGIPLAALGGLIVISDPLHDVDAIAVLSGGGTPRLREAARLLEEHYSEFVIITETGQDTPKYGPLSAVEKQELVDMGVQPRNIFITERHVDSTLDEARAIRSLLNQKGLKSVIVVTDPYHSLRTRLIFRDAFRESELEVYVRPVRDHWYNPATWWLSPQGWQVTLLEYSKLLGYVFFQR